MLDPWRLVFDPEWTVGLAVIAFDYWLVCRVLRRRGEAVPTRRIAAFAVGLAIIALALFSPIEHLALTSMLSFHLLQNAMLGDWAPPLLLLGLTAPMVAAVARTRWLRPVVSPRFALSFWLATWYVTHIPVVYDYSLRHSAALGVEHLAFLLSGLVFWWPEIVPGNLSSMGKVVYLGVAFLAISPLDLGIYLAPHALYDFYLHTPKVGGISALTDQQFAGAAMAFEANAVLAAVMTVNLLHALKDVPDTAGSRFHHETGDFGA
ncbi:MAG: cytochrome c oxidase assembly protein [Actinoallomurus sp.]